MKIFIDFIMNQLGINILPEIFQGTGAGSEKNWLWLRLLGKLPSSAAPGSGSNVLLKSMDPGGNPVSLP